MEQLDPHFDRDDHDFAPFNSPSRVIDSDGAFIGMLWFDDYALIDPCDSTTTVEEVMGGVAPGEFLSSGTAIMDAVSLFTTKHSGPSARSLRSSLREAMQKHGVGSRVEEPPAVLLPD
jgi:hypothetical protein